MLFVKREYDAEGRGLAVRDDVIIARPSRRQRVVVVASTLNRAVVQAVNVAHTMSDEIDVVHVTIDPAEGEAFRDRVEHQLPGVRTVIVESPYRSLVQPLVRYLEVSSADDPDRITIVVLPEYLPRHWWDRVLYNQNVHRIRRALVGRRDVVILDAPYRREA